MLSLRVVAPLVSLAAASEQAPAGLLVDLKPTPHVGIDRAHPQLSWIVPHLDHCGAGVAQKQHSFRAQVSATPSFDDSLLDDTGPVVSGESVAVPWPALTLEPATVYWWRVQTQTPEGCESDWSAPAKIVTGVFAGDFQAAKPVWADGSRYALLRKTVALPSSDSKLVSAHVYAAAAQDSDKERLLGAYRLYVDGVVAGTGPGRGSVVYSQDGHTDYDTIDITHLAEGKDELVLALQGYHHIGDSSAKMLLELHVLFEDGTKLVVGTDDTWHSFNADGLFNPTGSSAKAYAAPLEYIDARASPSGDGCQTCWRLPSFVPTANWTAAAVRPAFSPGIHAKETQPLQVVSGVAPRIVEVAPGHWFFDFGTEVMAGIELDWYDGEAELELTMGEELTSGSNVSVAPMRTTNTFDMKWTTGPGTSSLEQHEYFTFRYGELKGPAAASTCVKVEPHVDEGETISLGCPSGQVVSKVTFASYGTPSGECNEDGTNSFAVDKTCHVDSSASMLEALCLGKRSCSFKADNTAFGSDPCHGVGKGFAGAVECSASGSAEGLAGTPLPFKLTAWVVNYPWVEDDSSFESSDDMLNNVWELCKNSLKVTSLDTTTDSNTRERLPYEADGFITGSARYAFQREFTWQRHSSRHNMQNPTWPTEWRQTIPLLAHADYMMTGDAQLAETFYNLINASSQAQCTSSASGLVDFSHCSRPDGVRDIVDWPKDARDGYQMTDVNTVINAYAVGALQALSVLAGATGRTDEAARFENEAATMGEAITSQLFDTSTGLFVDGQGGKAGSHSAWHAQVFPLFFNLSDTSDGRLFAELKKKRMTGSVYGAFAFLLGLYRVGTDHGAFALEMMTNCDDNSWCNMIKQGATVTMEAWTRKEKPNLSWSHPWATAPATAIVQGLMGIRATEPGFRRFEVRPQPGSLKTASIKLPTLAGFIDASFRNSESAFELSLTVPGNTEATACLSSMGSADESVTVDGKVVAGRLDGDFVCVDGVGSGSHTLLRSPSVRFV